MVPNVWLYQINEDLHGIIFFVLSSTIIWVTEKQDLSKVGCILNEEMLFDYVTRDLLKV